MPPPDPSADQARAAIQAALGQIGFCPARHITIRRTRCGKPRCACAADPPVPARPLHPVDPHRPRQDRHPAAHPGPVPGLRALVRQRPPAPRADRRTEALSLEEMARAEGWATITPGTPAPPRTQPVRVPNHPKPPKTPGDQPA